MVKRFVILAAVACAGAVGLHLGAATISDQGSKREATRLRRPIALTLLDDGQRVLIGNRESGTLAIVHLETQIIESELRVARRMSDVVVSIKNGAILATDEAAGELVLVARHGKELREVGRRSVGQAPMSVRLDDRGTLASVACLWPRRLVLVDVATLAGDNVAKDATIELPFAPRRQILVPGTGKLIVVDGFGGQLAVVDLPSKSVSAIRELGAHNIRGLALDATGQQLLYTHQFLNATAPTQKGDIQNGNVLSNRVGKLSLAGLLGGATHADNERVYSIGDIERGAGDPADIVVAADGRALVALAGVDEFAIGRLDDVIWTRIPVGRSPTAIAYDAARQRAYVANTFADSISVIDCAAGKVLAELPLSPQAIEYSSAQRGEHLFHDARRSHDAWMSCQSCHPDGHTNGRLNDNLSDGSFGSPKRVLSLLGVKDTGPWAWNGGVKSLEDQVRSSFQSTMQGPPPSDADVRDVVAYLRTLPPPPGVLAARGAGANVRRERGERSFEELGCVQCHRPGTFTTAGVYSVGLDGDGGAKFNPPSLRGVSQGGPYFHDNRAASLEEVVMRYHHQLAGPLRANQAADLIEYLKSR